VDSEVAVYLNRLSDFFFVVARYAAMREGKTEIVYKAAGDDSHQRVPVIRPLSGPSLAPHPSPQTLQFLAVGFGVAAVVTALLRVLR